MIMNASWPVGFAKQNMAQLLNNRELRSATWYRVSTGTSLSGLGLMNRGQDNSAIVTIPPPFPASICPSPHPSPPCSSLPHYTQFSPP